MAESHLVILKKPYLDKILSGAKTIESRFSKTMIAPFGRIVSGDRLFFKVSSGPVCALGRAVKVEQFDDLIPAKVNLLRRKYDRHWYWKVENSPICWGWTAKEPVCHLTVGMLQEAFAWASGGKSFRIVETDCRATGKDLCIFRIDKTPGD